jgi:hypothetical protein
MDQNTPHNELPLLGGEGWGVERDDTTVKRPVLFLESVFISDLSYLLLITVPGVRISSWLLIGLPYTHAPLEPSGPPKVLRFWNQDLNLKCAIDLLWM